MNTTTIAIISGLTGMFGWGISGFLAKKTIDKIGDMRALVGVNLVGALMLSCIFLLSKQEMILLTIPQMITMFMLSAIDTAGYLYMYRAFRKGKISIVSPIVASSTSISIMIAIVFFKEVLSITNLVGIIFIFTGIMLISINFSKTKEVGYKLNPSRGITDALIAALLFGFWFPLWDNFIEKNGWLFYLLISKFIMCILFCGIYLLTNKKNSGGFEIKKTIIPLVFIAGFDVLAVLSITLGYFLIDSTSLITVLANGYSLPAIVLAYIFLKERLNIFQVAGIVITIIGIFVSSLA